jgi:hypothetical protein
MTAETRKRQKRLVGLRLPADKESEVDLKAKALGISRAEFCAMAVEAELKGRSASALIQTLLAERDQRLFALMHEALQDNLKVAQAERDTSRQILLEAVQVSQHLEAELRSLFEAPKPLPRSAPPVVSSAGGTRRNPHA